MERSLETSFKWPEDFGNDNDKKLLYAHVTRYVKWGGSLRDPVPSIPEILAVWQEFNEKRKMGRNNNRNQQLLPG